MEDFVKAQRIADMHQRDARRAAEIAEYLTHELVQFIHVDIAHIYPGQRAADREVL